MAIRTARIPMPGTEPIHKTLDRIAAFLPGNYRVAGWRWDRRAVPAGRGNDPARWVAFITGEDDAGWTLDDYVLPRLASGLIFAYEVDPSEAPTR